MQYTLVASLLALAIQPAFGEGAVRATPTATWHNATSFGSHIWSAHETNSIIKYLGNFSSASQCLDACIQWDAQPGAKCRALDWYSPKASDPHSQGCYARIDGVFESTPQPGVTSAVLDWPCARDEDCSLNGVCGASGACKCDPQWGGADCGELRLLPAPRGGGLQSPTLNYWGGNPFFAQGSYHVFGTEIVKGCQIGDFLTNSQVVHATSATPLGPYSVNTTWLEPFAHTPRAWPGPNNSLLLAYVGRQFVPPTGQRDCAAEEEAAAGGGAKPPTTQQTTVGARGEARAPFQQRNAQCLGLMVAQSSSGNVSGPWSHRFVYDPSYAEWYGRLDESSPDTDNGGGGSNYMEGGINNPSIFLFPNGTSLMAARTCTWPEQVVVASAPHWRGPYKSVVDGPVMPNPNPSDEDPFLWMDIRGHMHMLLHHQDGDANQLRNGAHAYSRDGVSWTWSPSIAYTTEVVWEDGESTHFARRERPALLLDPTWRVPLALFTAVSNGTRQWLHAQPISQAG